MHAELRSNRGQTDVQTRHCLPEVLPLSFIIAEEHCGLSFVPCQWTLLPKSDAQQCGFQSTQLDLAHLGPLVSMILSHASSPLVIPVRVQSQQRFSNTLSLAQLFSRNSAKRCIALYMPSKSRLWPMLLQVSLASTSAAFVSR